MVNQLKNWATMLTQGGNCKNTFLCYVGTCEDGDDDEEEGLTGGCPFTHEIFRGFSFNPFS